MVAPGVLTVDDLAVMEDHTAVPTALTQRGVQRANTASTAPLAMAVAAEVTAVTDPLRLSALVRSLMARKPTVRKSTAPDRLPLRL